MSKTREIIAFELRYQLRQPAFWIATLALVAFGILTMTTDVGILEGARGRVARNAPAAVVQSVTTISAVGMFAILAFVASAALRDFTTGAHPLIFSRPVATSEYLLGRFAGACIVSLLALGAGVLAMFVTSVLLDESSRELGATSLSPYFFAVGVQLVPNMLLLAATIFVFAVWTRALGSTFIGLLLFAIGQDIAEVLPVAELGETLPALLDPFGIAALAAATRYWSVADYVDSLPALSGALLANRILWTVVAVGLFVLGTQLFERGRSERRPLLAWRRRRGDRSPPADVERREPRSIPVRRAARGLPRAATIHTGPRYGIAVALRIGRFELVRLVRSLTFVLVTISGVGLVVLAATRREAILSVEAIPITRLMLTAIERVALLPVIMLVILCSGETVWRERVTHSAETLDTLPTPLWAVVAGKAGAVMLLVLGTLALYAGTAVGFQDAQGYENLEPGLYFGGVGLIALFYLVLCAVAVAVQVLAGGRFLGFLLIGVLLVARVLLMAGGPRSSLMLLGGGRVPLYSDMDGWGHRLAPFLWGQAYWVCIGAALLIVAGLFWPRGNTDGWAARLRGARGRLDARAWLGLALALAGAVASGGYVTYQTSGARRAPTRDDRKAAAAAYERRYAPLADQPRPRVTKIRADVDFHPESRSIEIRGEYELINPHEEPIESIVVSLDPEVLVRDLELSGGRAVETDDELGVVLLELSSELAPGESTSLRFDLALEHPGFGLRASDRWIRRNGTFVLGGTGTHRFFRGATLFPALGYDTTRELRSDRDRRRFDLDVWPGLPAPADAGARDREESGADWAPLELLVSTSADQTAVAPGRLEEEWASDGRRFFRYVTGTPVRAFFPIASARWTLARDRWRDVELEVYHHPEHAWNVEAVLQAMKVSLAFYDEHLGPYPGSVLRIVEFPGFGQFACSFPGLMGFAESMGFLSPTEETDVDVLLWIVAHEVAHQWWNWQVAAARARGSTMVSETLAQYGSLRVIEEQHGPEMGLRMAEHYRDDYLARRSEAGHAERPLALVEDQDFVHYAKGFVAMRAIARRAGPGAIDEALRAIVAEHAQRYAPFVTSTDVLDAIRERVPAEVHPMIHDLFERIVFLDASVDAARAEPLADGRYALTVDISARKLIADGDGNEEELEVDDSIEIAVYGGASGEDLLTIISGHLVGTTGSLEAVLSSEPTRVRLDPELMNIDRALDDNERAVLITTR